MNWPQRWFELCLSGPAGWEICSARLLFILLETVALRSTNHKLVSHSESYSEMDSQIGIEIEDFSQSADSECDCVSLTNPMPNASERNLLYGSNRFHSPARNICMHFCCIQYLWAFIRRQF